MSDIFTNAAPNPKDKFHVLFVLVITLLVVFNALGASFPTLNEYLPILELSLIMLSTAIISKGRLFSEVIYGKLYSWQDFIKTIAVALAIAIPYFWFIISNSTSWYVPLPFQVTGTTGAAGLAVLIVIGVEIEELLMSSILVPTIATNLRNVNAMAVLAFFGAITVYITFNLIYFAVVLAIIGAAFLGLKFARRNLNRSDPEKHLIAIIIVGLIFAGYHIWTGASEAALATIFGIFAVANIVNWWQQNTLASRIIHSFGNGGLILVSVGAAVAAGLAPSVYFWMGAYIFMLAVIFRGKIK